MSFNLFLIQTVLFTCVLLLLRARQSSQGWAIVAGIILAILAMSVVIVPGAAGFISGSLWVVFLLLPLFGFARVNQLVTQEQYRSAWKLARWLKWFHPVDGYLEYPQLLKGLELGQQGKLEEAKQLINQFQSGNPAFGRIATAMLYRMNADWHGLRQWVDQAVPNTFLAKEFWLTLLYLRSLGETGELNRLLQVVGQLEKNLGRNGNPEFLSTGRLYAMAFCGQVDQVERLLGQAFRHHPQQTWQFWLATAHLIAGHQEIGETMLEQLRQSSDRSLHSAIDWRLSASQIDPDRTLTPASRQILYQLKTSIGQDARYSTWFALSTRKSYVTYGLIGINLIVFAVSTYLGGSENLYVLYQLGALLPEAVFIDGEGWRSLTAIFLHAGALHLAANMLGLYVFGALVEAVLGHKKFLICYFFAGVGSMLTVATIAILTQATEQITVGASGAVLGIVGAEAAIQLKGWRFEKARIARDRLRLIAIVIGFQLVSDLITPQVSLIGHLSGVLLGFAVGLFLFNPRQQ